MHTGAEEAFHHSLLHAEESKFESRPSCSVFPIFGRRGVEVGVFALCPGPVSAAACAATGCVRWFAGPGAQVASYCALLQSLLAAVGPFAAASVGRLAC